MYSTSALLISLVLIFIFIGGGGNPLLFFRQKSNAPFTRAKLIVTNLVDSSEEEDARSGGRSTGGVQ